jgi:hypothetical protein
VPSETFERTTFHDRPDARLVAELIDSSEAAARAVVSALLQLLVLAAPGSVIGCEADETQVSGKTRLKTTAAVPEPSRNISWAISKRLCTRQPPSDHYFDKGKAENSRSKSTQ